MVRSLWQAVVVSSVLLVPDASLLAASPGGSPSRPQPGPTATALPPEAPAQGLVVTIDVATNRLALFRDGMPVIETAVATGSDRVLRRGSKTWWFRTPRGLHTVRGRIKDPVWRKPDWAFIEEGKKVPPANSPLRLEKGPMGKYALDLGGGILIHGTDNPKSIGQKASHGCIRVGAAALEKLWREVGVGTPVYIYESARSTALANSTGLNDLDLVLDE